MAGLRPASREVQAGSPVFSVPSAGVSDSGRWLCGEWIGDLEKYAYFPLTMVVWLAAIEVVGPGNLRRTS